MDKKTFDERVEKIKEVDKIIKALDPTIRESSFKLLQTYITGRKVISEDDDENGALEGKVKEEFFTKAENNSPSDNVLLIAAYLYSKYGSEPFSLDEIEGLASEVGITIPTRPDMTLKVSSRANKNLFASAGKAKYKPTVHGEAYLKKTYEIKKGRQKREANNS